MILKYSLPCLLRIYIYFGLLHGADVCRNSSMLSHVDAEGSSSQIIDLPSLICTISPEPSMKIAKVRRIHNLVAASLSRNLVGVRIW